MRLVVALSAVLLCSAVSVQAQEFQENHMAKKKALFRLGVEMLKWV